MHIVGMLRPPGHNASESNMDIYVAQLCNGLISPRYGSKTDYLSRLFTKTIAGSEDTTGAEIDSLQSNI
jgi:hypothetical protein